MIQRAGTELSRKAAAGTDGRTDADGRARKPRRDVLFRDQEAHADREEKRRRAAEQCASGAEGSSPTSAGRRPPCTGMVPKADDLLVRGLCHTDDVARRAAARLQAAVPPETKAEPEHDRDQEPGNPRLGPSSAADDRTR
ncbi:hypothetical protein GCM10010360_28550 [Streptomyces nogalater]